MEAVHFETLMQLFAPEAVQIGNAGRVASFRSGKAPIKPSEAERDWGRFSAASHRPVAFRTVKNAVRNSPGCIRMVSVRRSALDDGAEGGMMFSG